MEPSGRNPRQRMTDATAAKTGSTRCNDLKQVLAKIVDREPDLRLAA
jgi:hypothetical protein